MALTLSAIPDHIYHFHTDLKAKLDMAKLTEIEKEYSLQSEMPTKSGPIPRLYCLNS